MVTFALVHGVIAMDLPITDSTASYDDYAETTRTAMASDCADDLILVGRSMAGLTVPLVAAQRQVRRLVYLCALVPTAPMWCVRRIGW